MQRAFALTLASALVLVACGGGESESVGDTADEPRTVEVSMTDMAYAPASLDVEVGETIRFVFRNDGAVRHEAVVGDQQQQEAHHAEMAEMTGSHDDMDMGTGDMGTGDMESMDHAGMDELHGVVVEPGQTAELVHTFDTAGTLMIGCHEPGHWEAGMKMTIDV